MSRWRPSPEEERWLDVASGFGAAVPRKALIERTGGWRSTGPLARIALFVMGVVAAALFFGILRSGDEITLLVAGLAAALAAEWLHVAYRLHASGVEEGLCVAGFLLIGAWITLIIGPGAGFAGGTADALMLIAVAGAAGLRLLNPFVTTCAVLALVYWVDSTSAARALDQTIGAGMTAFACGWALALLALVLGAREYRRPSHDRMLDWLVATLPLAAYSQRAGWEAHAVLDGSGGSGPGHLATVVPLLALGAALLVTGLRRRRHAPILGFMGCIACVAVELRFAITLNTETWLIGYGLAALVTGVAMDRYLRQPRNGLTSAALTRRRGSLDLLQTAGAAVLAQRSAPEAPVPEPEFASGEGRFGGGGASSRY